MKFIAYLVQSSWLLNLRRALMRVFHSSITKPSQNIVYLSWLVDIEKARSRYPKHVQLWKKQGKTIFTILTYQHQHLALLS